MYRDSGIERDHWHKMGLSKRETPQMYLEESLVTTHSQLCQCWKE